MRRMIPFALVGVLLAIAGIFVFQVVTSLGDIRPAFFPSSRSVIRSSSQPSRSTTSNTTSLQIPEGFSLTVFAQGITGARDLALTPDGGLLVSQPNQGRVVILRDTNGDGQAETPQVLLEKLRKPHGLLVHNNTVFVAEETALKRYRYEKGSLVFEKTVLTLPAGGRHTSRTLAIDAQERLYVSLGSTCDVCIEKHPWIGTVIQTDLNGTNPTVLAQGLRNAVFLTYEGSTDSLWATEMGRDMLGDSLPPDEINRVQSGHYGWPHCYGNQVKDEKSGLSQTVSFDCSQTRTPSYQIPAHSAPLGLTVITSDRFPDDWQGDLLVAYHGSWNSSTPVGYKVVRLHKDGTTITKEEDFITGFLQGKTAASRPVDLAFDANGILYLSDDKGGFIFRIEGKR